MRACNIEAIKPTSRLNDLYSVSCAALGGSLHIEDNNKYLLWNTGTGYKFNSCGDEVTEGTHLIKYLKETAPDLLADWRSRPFVPKNKIPYQPDIFKQQMEEFVSNNKGDNEKTAGEKMKQQVTPKIDINKIQLPDSNMMQATGKFYQTNNKIEKAKILLSQNFIFRRNVITAKYEYCIKGQDVFYEFNDRVFNSIKQRINVTYIEKLNDNDLRMIIESDFAYDYCPITEYFNTLKSWDCKTNYIKQLSELVTVKPEQFGKDEKGNIRNAAVTWEAYLKRWLIASVATMLQRSVNHSCLTLLGEQGLGKTTFLRKLCIADDLVYIGALNPADKDSKIYYTEKALIVLDELEATTKFELAQLKSNMTLPSVTVRRPYARQPEVLPRRASFCASANDIQVLSDLTGSRRWLCVEVDSIRYNEVTPELMKQVYSQALHLLNTGAKFWFDGNEIAFLEKNNERFYQPLAEEEALFKIVLHPNDVKILQDTIRIKTNTELLSEMSDKFPGVKFSGKKLGQVLNKHKFIRKCRSDDHLQGYEVVKVQA